MIDTRPMSTSDLAAAEQVWADAFSSMRVVYNLPVIPRTPESAARQRHQIAHKLATDPAGSWVAVDGSRLVGLAQALVRERVWVLSLLGVDPGYQDHGVGRQLIERALDYGDRASPGIILSSRDTRAMRRYALAGFSLHPSVSSWGTVRPGTVTPPTGVEEAGIEALEVVESVDRQVRDASRAPDVALMITDGARLMVDGSRGYAVFDGPRIRTVAAVDEHAATRVLRAVLARTARSSASSSGDGMVEASWISGNQQWAIHALVEAGIELHPVGAVMVRGWPEPPLHYLPSGAFG